jgi:hypothetical protein
VAVGAACSSGSSADGDAGKYDKAKYCAAVGPTIKGAVDDEGRALDTFGPRERRRSYFRLAAFAPPSVREDWEEIGSVVGGDAKWRDGKITLKEFERHKRAERRVIASAKTICGIEVKSF